MNSRYGSSIRLVAVPSVIWNSRHLNPNRTLRAIQSPGLIEADAAEVAIEEMATLYIAEMQKCSLKGLISSVVGVLAVRLHTRSVVSCVKWDNRSQGLS
jgi:hypothetical protein